ncbi:MAG: hypothetical protein CMH30_08790 [Micavibrio sp.]|nr:hypothetical protein [Micavibrio sp.]
MLDDFNASYQQIEKGFRRKFPEPQAREAHTTIIMGKTYNIPARAAEPEFDQGSPVKVRKGFERAMRIFEGAPDLLGEDTQKWIALGLLAYYLDNLATSPTGTVDGFSTAIMDEEETEILALDKTPQKITATAIVLSEKYNLSPEKSILMARGYTYPFIYKILTDLSEETVENPFTPDQLHAKQTASSNYALRCAV